MCRVLGPVKALLPLVRDLDGLTLTFRWGEEEEEEEIKMSVGDRKEGKNIVN